MTDREKLIELLNENFCEYCNVDIIAGSCKIRAITFDVDRFAYFLIANGVTVQRWIPASERLPEENKRILACLSSKITVVAYLRQNVWYVAWNQAPLNHVTHWMPLPEPSKEENNDC